MEQLNTEDSYAERRLLFKNVWQSALDTNGTDPNITNKPKIIRTLRLDDIDRCYLVNKKKKKVKHLRHVCNKLLNVCNRQGNNNLFYEQNNFESQRPKHNAYNTCPKKKKKTKRKKATYEDKVEQTTRINKALITTDLNNEALATISTVRIKTPRVKGILCPKYRNTKKKLKKKNYP